MDFLIKTVSEKRLIGNRLSMSISEDKTYKLWSTFMPRRREIHNISGNELYSVQVFDSSFNFSVFDLNAHFSKWAAAEVSDLAHVPVGMESLTIPKGLYAIFIHYGPAAYGERTMRYIFETWLPTSGYVIDDRPHFMVMGAKYNQFSADSEEEVYLPIKPSQ